MLKAYLSSANLLHNLQVIKSHAQASEVIPLLKANAYGHGMLEVAKRLSPHVNLMGVTSIEKAILLRQSGINNDILLAQGVDSFEDFKVAEAHNFTILVHEKKHLDWLENSVPKNKVKVWIKLNTGLNRLGFSKEEIGSVYSLLLESGKVDVDFLTLMTHLPATGDPSHFSNDLALKVFDEVSLPIKKSVCDSGGIFFFKDYHFDYVRTAIGLFGVSSFTTSAEGLNLKPVMTLKTNLRIVRDIKEGEYLGYYFRTRAQKDMRIGLACVGYGDGYPFTAPTGTPFLVDGKVCPLIGRVSLDVVMLDLENNPQATSDSEITVWGEGLPLDQIIQYTELPPGVMLSNLQARVPRIWDDAV